MVGCELEMVGCEQYVDSRFVFVWLDWYDQTMI